MAIRKCPACLASASMGAVTAHSDDFVCAGCSQHLQVAEASRVLASAVGIAASYLALRAAPSPHSTLGWAVPVLFALLAYGCVSALMLMLSADLQLIPAPVQPAATPEPAAQASHH